MNTIDEVISQYDLTKRQETLARKNIDLRINQEPYYFHKPYHAAHHVCACIITNRLQEMLE